MPMKISEKDFLLLTSMVEFHFKFSEYIRETDRDLFYRAVDYAKTYAKNDNGIVFDYWHEDNKKFLDELLRTLVKTESSFNRLVNKVGNEDEAKEIWMKKKKTQKDDLLGMKNYLANFIHHARSLSYENFDTTDWSNFVKVCKYITDDPKFIEFAIEQIKKNLGDTSDFLKEFK